MSKDLLDWFKSMGKDQYGAVIAGEDVRAVLGLTMPEYGTKRDFDAVVLVELSAIDYVRNFLLNEGKYLAQDRGAYRVLLPSENTKQVELYMGSADKKLRRAQKLLRNTPTKPTNNYSNLDARIKMKRDYIQEKSL